MTRFLLLAPLAAALVACPTPAPDDDDDAPPGDGDWHALVVHAPFAGDATVATVSHPDGAVADDLLGLAGSDWMFASDGGAVWLIGRFFIDTVRRYDGLDFAAPALEFSTGPGTNPHGLAICGDRLFVTRYDLTEDATAGGDVAMFDLATGGYLGRVDLSAYEPHGDGTPEPHDLAVLGETAYVALKQFDREAGWVPEPEARVVAIDCATGEVVDDFAVGQDPSVAVDPDGGGVRVSHDGGLDLLDPSTGDVTPLVEGAAFGPDHAYIGAVGDAGGLIAVLEVDGFVNEVWCVDPATGEGSLLTSVENRLWSLRRAPDGGAWALWRDHWASDATVEPGGIAIYDPATCTERTAEDGWLTFASDPYSVAFHEAG